jgi:hypothetical protein
LRGEPYFFEKIKYLFVRWRTFYGVTVMQKGHDDIEVLEMPTAKVEVAYPSRGVLKYTSVQVKHCVLLNWKNG